ncbi:MAG: hypothetical protein K0V04_29580 [Deltaproteobacteria bacterium]|nr:hypothetical protein [Deltaproteobacteria bacterium]
MSAAIDRTRWARRPSPRTLDEVAAIAQRGGVPLRAHLTFGNGDQGDVYWHGDRVTHAKLGWALGQRALVRLLAREPFFRVQLSLHAVPELLTVGLAWGAVRATASAVADPVRNERRRGPRDTRRRNSREGRSLLEATQRIVLFL